MDFECTEAQKSVQERARRCAAELSPLQYEEAESVPAEVYANLGKAGLMAVNLPKRFGGSESGVVAYSLAMMEVGAGCASTAVTMAVTNMVGEVINEFGSDAQRERYLPLLAKGRHGAFALSEVDAGSDPAGMRTRAVKDQDEWVLTGTKQWISHADTCAVMVVWARVEDPSLGKRTLTCFLVPADAKGLSVAKHEEKMGLRASHTCAIALDGVRVPSDAVLGQLGGGFSIAMMALDGGRIGIASQAIGIADAALDEAKRFARESSSTDQGALFRIADAETSLSASRLLTLRAAQLKESKQPFSQEASMAKAFATEAAWKVCNLSLEVMGDEGLAKISRVSQCLRDVRVTRIYEGTSEVQRVVISRALLRG